MATVTWNYFLYRTLAPGQNTGVSWGPDNALKGASFTITAHPTTNLRNTNFWLTVSEVSIGNRDIGQGDISNITTTLWARVTNNGGTGDGKVPSFAVYLTRNTP